MKRNLSLFSILFGLPFLCAIITMASCDSHDNPQFYQNNLTAAKSYLKNYINYFPKFANEKIISHNSVSGNRKKAPDTTSKPSNIFYASIPEGTPNSIIYRCENATSISELLELSDQYAVRYSEQRESDQDLELIVDYQVVYNELKPIIETSKQYFYDKGFTEIELNEMLETDTLTELDLIPMAYAFALTEIDMENGGTLFENNKDDLEQEMASLLGIQSCQAVNGWHVAGVVVGCGVRALGINLREFMVQSSLKSWTKFAIKKAAKSILKRVIGPIGVVLWATDFASCVGGIGALASAWEIISNL